MAVVDQLGIPLAGLGPQEAVEALEAASRRPVAARGGEVHLRLRAQMPLADHVRVPALLAEDLLQLAVLGRDHAAGVREPARRLGDAGHAVARVVAAVEQARARRRAQRRRVPLRVAHAVAGDPVDVRRLDRPAVAARSPRTRRRRARRRSRSARRRAPSAARTATSRAPSRGASPGGGRLCRVAAAWVLTVGAIVPLILLRTTNTGEASTC